MADLPPHLPPPANYELMALAITKIAPAMAGAYIRNLFPPRKPFMQRAAEAFGGVLLVVYGGQVAGGALWALLAWGLSLIGIGDMTGLIRRDQSDLLAAFLVGLVGMTVVEGGLLFVRSWLRERTP